MGKPITDLTAAVNSTEMNPTNFNAWTTTAINASNAYYTHETVYNVKSASQTNIATGDGSTDDRAAINEAHTAATANGGIIFFPGGSSSSTYRMSSGLTINSDVMLVFGEGAKVSIDDTFTLTINGKIQPGMSQIFSGDGAVALADGSCEYVTPQMFGATGDGSTDDSQAFLDTIAAIPAGHKIQIPHGTYIITEQLAITKAVTIEGIGKESVLNLAGVDATNDYSVYIYGAKTATTSDLSANAAADQTTVNVDDASAFSADDWIRIESEGTWNSGSCTLAEIQQIESIAANAITLKNKLYDAYTTADSAAIYLCTMLDGVVIRDLHIIGRGTGNGTAWNGCVITYAMNVLINNCGMDKGYTTGFTMKNCINATVRDCSIRFSDHTSIGYGVQFTEASRHLNVIDNKFHATRHSVSLGGGDGVQRQVSIVGNHHIMGNAAQVGMFGGHNTYDGVVIANNTAIQDSLGYSNSPNTVFANNNCYNTLSDNGAILVRAYSKYTVISGNTLECGVDSPVLDVRCPDTLITGNNIIGQYGYGAVLLHYDAVRCTISNNNIVATGSGNEAIFVSTGGNTAASDELIISGNTITSAADAVAFEPTAYDLTDIVVANNTIDAAANAIRVIKDSTETLKETDFATHEKWDVAGDFDDSGGNAAYTHSAGSGTLTQTEANLMTAWVASRGYTLSYTVSGSSGDPAAEITAACATVATALTLTDGSHTTTFTTIADPGSFIISATSSSGGFTLDDVTLAWTVPGRVKRMNISNNIVQDGTSSVNISNADDVTINGNILKTATSTNISLNTATNIRVTDNDMASSARCVYAHTSSSNVRLSGNRITAGDGSEAIEFRACTGSVVDNEIIGSGNRMGLSYSIMTRQMSSALITKSQPPEQAARLCVFIQPVQPGQYQNTG